MTVRAWLPSVENYLGVSKIGQQTKFDSRTAVDFASAYMAGPSANWWLTLVLVKLEQSTGVAAFLVDFRKFAIDIPGINETKKMEQ